MGKVSRKCPECGFEDEIELKDIEDSHIEVLCGECDTDYSNYGM